MVDLRTIRNRAGAGQGGVAGRLCRGDAGTIAVPPEWPGGETLGGGAWGQAWGGSEVTGGPAVSMSRRVAAAKLAVLRFYRG